MLSYTNHSQKIAQIKDGSLSLIENVSFFLNRIEEKKHLNAFNFVFNDAHDKAAEIESKIKNGTHGKLAGMVIAVKDVLSVKDKPTTCSSNILRNFKALYTATAIQKLINEDAIIIGKTNCDEFAMGSSNENSAFGCALNPHDETRVPGGSSGGSAVAVAANLCDAALGTDTGGSIRQPAALTGLFGIKPTYGLVSRYGLTAFASSFDSIGSLAKNTQDAALILSVMSGHDEKDSTSIKREQQDFVSNLETEKKFTIGIPTEFFGEGLNQEINDTIRKVITLLKDNGHEIIDLHLPNNEYAIATYYILTTAEASSNLARYDGVRYTNRSADSKNLSDMYTNTRSEGFGTEVKRRIMLGTYVLSAGYYDAYYRKAQKVRRVIKNDFDKAFEQADIILCPTTPTTAFKIGEKSEDPLQMYLNDVYTTSANLAGIPAISIPIETDSNGLPIGIQLMGNQLQENKIFQLSRIIENLIG